MTLKNALLIFKPSFLDFGKSQKLLGAESSRKGVVSISKHLDRKCLLGWSVVVVEEPFDGPKWGHFLCTDL
jgi:hypothetical protein